MASREKSWIGASIRSTSFIAPGISEGSARTRSHWSGYSANSATALVIAKIVATTRSTTCSASRVMSSVIVASSRGRSGLITTRRSASWSTPSLHSVLPRSTWFMSSFIITPDAEENVSQSRSARVTEACRVSANISYWGSQTAGPRSLRCR